LAFIRLALNQPSATAQLANVSPLKDRPVSTPTAIVTGLSAMAAVGAGVFVLIGPMKIWGWLGPADLGPVVFETLTRRTSPNDALACPVGLCASKGDMVPSLFKGSGRELRVAFAKVIASEPSVERVASDEATQTDRYIQRSRLMRYPDTIVVRFLDRADGRSTVAMYSRSLVGRSDFGVNRARLERWFAKLATQAVVAD
jgi:uncharacterized protein (DUF1499 family)